jgi:hypothetical protein
MGNIVFFLSGLRIFHHFNADPSPDPALHFDADPDLDPALLFDPDPDPAPHQSDQNLQPLV